MRDLSRTKDQEHVENDGSIAISLLVAVALALSWSIVSIAAYSHRGIFISLQARYRYQLCVLTLKQIYHRI